MNKKISIVTPVCNAADIIDHLLAAVEEQRLLYGWNLEMILVDDGSVDNTCDRIVELCKPYPYIKGIKLSRNFGQQAAVKTGLAYATGEYIAIIDDDLQDPPSLLQGFFGYLEQGYDVVYGVRKNRKEHFVMKLCYYGFYRLLRRLSDIKVPLDTGDFCAMTRRVVDNMLRFEEKRLFLRGIRASVGLRQIGVAYERPARVGGRSRQTLRKSLGFAADGIFSFSTVPLRLITLLGFVGLSFAVLYSMYTVYEKITHSVPVQGFTALVVIISFFSSLILICLGLIGEYIARIYDEVRNRPSAIIDKTINL